MKPLVFAAVALCFVVSTSGALQVTQPAPAQLAFDVVSLKPDVQTTGFVGVSCHGTDGTVPPSRAIGMGMCVGSRATAELFVDFAYDVGESMSNLPLKGTITGEPDWFDKDRFALQAKAENPPMLKELRMMLQDVLGDKFKLRGHIEIRQFDGYALVVGKNGLKFDPEETSQMRGRQTSSLQRASGNVSIPSSIGFSMRGTAGAIGPPTITARSLNLRNVSMDAIAKWLTTDLGKPVVNETKLEGNYNLLTAQFSTANEVDSQAPSLSTVIDQIGLKLQSQGVPVHVFVIEHVEKPTFN